MHLKTLTLRGFKSFASTTTLKLEPGITCVVGPNGSGKSNVVDALTWVMGEQGAKSLRGSNMSDVIFAGTSGRAALGRAQVELTIDNTDGALPIDYTEVTIGRTLFRGGASEYTINGTPARLLDIQELLSDTGMGRQMHVIVGQGRLDSILQATPQERRGFIEEAAGVLKHRRRKERALKKLADMDANLVRVLDLTQEIHRQLGPLARQARTARKASLIHARVRDATARLLADDLASTRESLTEHARGNEATLRRTHAIEEQIAAAAATVEKLEADERALADSLEKASRSWQEITGLHERLRGTLRAAQERVKYLQDPPEMPRGDDPDLLDRRAQHASEEDRRLLEEVEEAKSVLSTLIRAQDEAETAERAAGNEFARLSRAEADYRERVARLSGDVGAAATRLEAAQSEAERARQAAGEARDRVTGAHERLKEAPELVDTQSSAATDYEDAVSARDTQRARVDALLRQERQARADLAHWEARRDALSESLNRDDDTAHLLGREGILGAVSGFVSAESGTENAIAALLAPFADAVLVANVDYALAEVERAESQGSGQLRMLLSLEETNADVLQEHESPAPQDARWAIDLVRAADPIAHTLRAVLAGAVVVENLQAAQRALDQPGVRVAATLSGAIVRRESIIGSGTVVDSLLALSAQRDDAAAHAKNARLRCEQISGELEATNTLLDAAIRRANEALKTLRAHDAAAAKISQERASLVSAEKAAQAEWERVQRAVEKADEHIQWASDGLAAARARLAQSQDTGPDGDLETARSYADAAAKRAKKAREAHTQARLSLRALEEQSRNAQARARSLRQAAAKEREERRRYAQREERRTRKLASAEKIAADAHAGVQAGARALERARALRASYEARRTTILDALSAARSDGEKARNALAEVKGKAQRDEIARAQLELRLEEFERRSLRELLMEPDALIGEFGPHMLVPVFPKDPDEVVEDQPVPYIRSEQEEALEKATKELSRLGKVNPLALEEHDALAKRYEFLSSQVRDLKDSKADLLRIIDDVDRLVEEAFTQAFSDTRQEFAHIFEVLFPGGKGDLVLTDPHSPLDTGIEIEARPAGKKVKRMSLLSGGERSLAAIAFLVAIFKARPSPFYVMDEVEAALDDVNLSRLLKILIELREESQLIVITHQKRTMEIADALYGVTMREGVTQLVSQRLV